MNKSVLCEYPLIETYQDFLSPDECLKIIDLSRSKLVAGGVIGEDGSLQLDYNHRNASTVPAPGFGDELTQINDVIADRISNTLSVDKARFEKIAVINYATGQEFKVHQDYFIGTKNLDADNKRCINGGNRVSTIIIYLNNVEAGGETYFPWVDIKIKPKCGTMVHFDYGYNDWEANIRTQHAGMPVISDEKWIITVWVREESLNVLVPDYKKFELESTVYSRLADVEYEIMTGPENDRQPLKISLPANNDPMNAIVVGFTGGMDSALLLYLLGMCNNMQAIPYKIRPVCVTSKLCKDPEKIQEDWENVELMASYITDLVGGNIDQLQYISAPEDSIRKRQISDGLYRYFSPENGFDYHRFRKFQYIFTGANALPHGSYFADFRRPTNVPLPWVLPFLELQKYHIVDAILLLGLEEILEKTAKCGTNHTTLLDQCLTFACNERRWAFTMINREEIGSKHFLNKGYIMKTQLPLIKRQAKLPAGTITTKPKDLGTKAPAGVGAPPPTVG